MDSSNTANGVVRVNPDGSWKEIANLSLFQKLHPVEASRTG